MPVLMNAKLSNKLLKSKCSNSYILQSLIGHTTSAWDSNRKFGFYDIKPLTCIILLLLHWTSNGIFLATQYCDKWTNYALSYVNIHIEFTEIYCGRYGYILIMRNFVLPDNSFGCLRRVRKLFYMFNFGDKRIK